MKKLFRQNKHICIHGLGGLGKTTLAEAFANNYENRQFKIIDFRNGVGITEAAILERLLGRYKRSKPDEDILADTEDYINSAGTNPLQKLNKLINIYLKGRKTILLFDNVEDAQTDEGGDYQRRIGSETLSAFLRHLCKNTPHDCHIVFTTRYTIEDLADVLEHLTLDKLGYAEQYRLFNYSEILRDIPMQDRENIYQRLDGHPRGYEYLEALLKKDKTFSWQQVSRAEAEVFENLLLAKVYERLTGREKAIFQIVAVFITRTPLAALAAVSGEAEADLIPVLRALQDWSLCFLEKDGRFEVHRLTREWMAQEVIDPAKVKEWALLAGEYFKEQRTWDDEILAKNYFELGEAWMRFAETSFNIQGYYQLIGLYTQAFELNKAVLAKNIDALVNADALNYNGVISLSVSDYDTALSYLEQSLTIQIQIRNRRGAGDTLNNISHIYSVKGDYETALNYLQQSLIIQQEIGNSLGEGTTLNNISQIYFDKGDYNTAMHYAEQSLAIRQQIGELKGEGRNLLNLGTIAYARGDYSKALSYWEQSLTIQRQIGDRYGEASTLSSLATVLSAKGNYETAFGYLEQSLTISQQIGDRKGSGSTLNNLAANAYKKGDYIKALHFWKQSLVIQQEIGNRKGEGVILSNISQIHSAKGDYETALRYLEQSLAIQQQIGDRQGEGVTLNNISQIYYAKGDYDTPLSYLEQSLVIQQEIGDLNGEGTTLNNLGAIAFRKGDCNTALSYLEQSLAIQQQIGNRKDEGVALRGISEIHFTKGDYDAALSYSEQSLAIQMEIGNIDGMASALYIMGLIYFSESNFENAILHFIQAYQIFHQIGSSNTKAIEDYLDAIIERIGETKFQEILSQLNQE